ncbi:homeobox-leucine zipper protein ROC8-like isoform X2 [Nicotiana tabacum]|uniref:Homeobox-leucine zipper protein ROC8-like isoform X2 n=1 Tax=Nicotiana tabacum TaxID=4097 RepID=A0AC58SAF8_TOBAC|nr:homeobox-leucine zipper protein ROC8-like [Nicotiana tomentosiformis]
MDSPSGSSSDEQIQKLEEVFSQTPNPENDVIEKLSEELGLDTNHVKIWFDNKRCYIQAQRDKEEGENLRLENSRLLSENLQMSLELRNRLCATCNPEKQRKLLQDLQNENAILQTELTIISKMHDHLKENPERYLLLKYHLRNYDNPSGLDLDLKVECDHNFPRLNWN